MRLILLVMLAAFAVLGTSSNVLAQGSYESTMEQLAEGIHSSLSGTENRTVLVCFFRRLEGKGCNLDETITGDFEVAFGKLPRTYKVLNRSVLDKYNEEHRLEMESQMDEEQRMKKAASLLKADIMIFGSYRFSGNNLVLRVHADDIQTSEQLAILSLTCVPTKMLKKFCEEAGTGPAVGGSRPTTGAPGTRSEPGTSTDTQPGETTPAKPCGSQNGECCFTNTGTTMVNVGSNKLGNGKHLQIAAGATECFYDLPAGVYDYSSSVKYDATASYPQPRGRKGNFRVEPCKTQTITVP